MLPHDFIDKFGEPIIYQSSVAVPAFVRFVQPCRDRWSLSFFGPSGVTVVVRPVVTGFTPNGFTVSGTLPLTLVYPYDGLLSTLGWEIQGTMGGSITVVECRAVRGLRADFPTVSPHRVETPGKRLTPTPSAAYFLSQRKR